MLARPILACRIALFGLLLTLAPGGPGLAAPQDTAPAPSQVTYAPPPRKGDAPPLTIGDVAPALDIAHWLRGEAVVVFQPDHIYVVEFWATWCGPCVKNMPHLTQLQRENADRGVTVIGVSDEPLQTVVSFLTSHDKSTGSLWSDKIGYTLATDPDGSTQRDYMTAAGLNGLPTAFIVGRDGRIEWVGHPIEMDQPFGQVVAGTWDRTVFKTAFEIRMAPAHRVAALSARIEDARIRRDWDAALGAFDEMIALGENYRYARSGKFRFMLNEVKDYPRAYAYGRDLLTFAWEDDAVMLNQIAWFIMDDPIEQRDLDLALKAATRANELSEGNDPEHVSRLAHIQFARGEPAAAVDLQRKALDLAREQGFPNDTVQRMQAELREYERASNREAADGGSP